MSDETIDSITSGNGISKEIQPSTSDVGNSVEQRSGEGGLRKEEFGVSNKRDDN